uniref:Uncharacterized protein n=1 Tax=Romanomermis culicivorax TaxID=13658 RepID=A0A915KEC6_ROMCU
MNMWWNGPGTRRVNLTLKLLHTGDAKEEIVFKLRKSDASGDFLKISLKNGSTNERNLTYITILPKDISTYKVFVNGRLDEGAEIRDETDYDILQLEKGKDLVNVQNLCAVLRQCIAFEKGTESFTWKSLSNRATAILMKFNYPDSIYKVQLSLRKSQVNSYFPSNLKIYIDGTNFTAIRYKNFVTNTVGLVHNDNPIKTLSIFQSQHNHNKGYRIFANGDTNFGGFILDNETYNVLQWNENAAEIFLKLDELCIFS